MSSDDIATRLEIRSSRGKVLGILAMVAVMAVLFVALCAVVATGSDRARPDPLWIGGGLLVLAALVMSPAFLDRAPHLIVESRGLSWRKGGRKAPLAFIAWADVASAALREGGQDDPRCLRLNLTAESALTRVSSRDTPRWIDIPITAIDTSDRQLKQAIHRVAPRLFADADHET